MPQEDALPASRQAEQGLLRRLVSIARSGDLVALFWELVRFGWVGFFTLGVYAAEMWLLAHYTTWPTWLNGTLSYGPCLLVNYLLHRSFTFRSDRQHSVAGPRYLAIQLGGMAFNTGVLWLGVEHWGWPYFPSQVVAVMVLAAWSYVGQKAWAF